jgi:outer membrane protein assembly factor BamE (lipoprotein component of BamABCDE complex)
MRRLLAGLLFASLAGCVVFNDQGGVPVTQADAAVIVPGQTTRAEVLAQLGPPTGYYTMDLEAVVTRLGNPLQ